MENFEVVIVGGGLGGLACGVMLSKEGMKVCECCSSTHIPTI